MIARALYLWKLNREIDRGIKRQRIAREERAASARRALRRKPPP